MLPRPRELVLSVRVEHVLSDKYSSSSESSESLESSSSSEPQSEFSSLQKPVTLETSSSSDPKALMPQKSFGTLRCGFRTPTFAHEQFSSKSWRAWYSVLSASWRADPKCCDEDGVSTTPGWFAYDEEAKAPDASPFSRRLSWGRRARKRSLRHIREASMCASVAGIALRRTRRTCHRSR